QDQRWTWQESQYLFKVTWKWSLGVRLSSMNSQPPLIPGVPGGPSDLRSLLLTCTCCHRAPGVLDLFRGTLLLLRGKPPSGMLMESHHHSQKTATLAWSLCFAYKRV
ncbi:mCG145278, partial [Mus musculus]